MLETDVLPFEENSIPCSLITTAIPTSILQSSHKKKTPSCVMMSHADVSVILSCMHEVAAVSHAEHFQDQRSLYTLACFPNYFI